MTKNRTSIYLRVSTDGQTVENQRRDLTAFAELKGWPIVATYEDAGISGAKGREHRPGLDALLKDARKRRFDRVLFWSVDRLGRSTATVTQHMADFAGAGVAQFYFKESMDTATAHGRAMLEMAAVFGTLEREMIRERVKAGIDRVRATGKTKSGKPIGRPKVGGDVEAKVVELRAAGMGIRAIAAEVGCGVGTVLRITA
ncbi:recombinase family protein [Reyranella sp. CPCC 100927]|uniref:recombinase family protein n=1 Tax=Reyranella sp. CPCC 100927 TaxID=2599616 RepID=UPI0011B558A9|nr:recombinase family protein [Reyranella sp. CPCC 100927]TWS94984.1 helix-turn-helix domain-containing protein [Reyranella sp. CPCC 100927]